MNSLKKLACLIMFIHLQTVVLLESYQIRLLVLLISGAMSGMQRSGTDASDQWGYVRSAETWSMERVPSRSRRKKMQVLSASGLTTNNGAVQTPCLLNGCGTGT